MKRFSDRLIQSIKEKDSVIVVGLDPTIENVPGHILAEAVENYGNTKRAIAFAFSLFDRKIIDAISDLAVAVKPQIAFYEQYGHYGIKALGETIHYARRRKLIVIVDAKRNDIGSTAVAYANAFLGRVNLTGSVQRESFGVDAITVNPYLGHDCLKPFIETAETYGKGLFVLAKTSNPSSADFQDLRCGQRRLFEIVAERVCLWGSHMIGQQGYSDIGAVVGATYPREAAILRRLLPRSFFLVPGYGAQGATAEDVLPCFNEDGLGALISSSRNIIFAYKQRPWNAKFSELEFDQAARASAEAMRHAINGLLHACGRSQLEIPAGEEETSLR